MHRNHIRMMMPFMMLVKQIVHQIPDNPHPKDTKRNAIGMRR